MNAYGDTPASYDADQQHLLLLRIFHYIFAGLQGLYGLLLLFQLVLLNSMYSNITSSAFRDFEVEGQTINLSPPSHPSAPLTVMSMLMFALLALVVVMILCNLITAHSLAVRRNYTFCLVISGINCMLAPIGTALGVFTIVVLLRPSVKRLFTRTSF